MAMESVLRRYAPEEPTTRDLLVRTAIKVFAERGFDAATLREITQRAGANVAAVNYYFRSKDELVRCALEACLAPINAARKAALGAFENGEANALPDLDTVVEALVRPIVELGVDEEGGRAPIRLLMQARALPKPLTNRILAEQFDDVHRAFLATFARLLPHLEPDELALRYEFSRGAVVQIVADLDPTVHRLRGFSAIDVPEDNESIIRNLVAFITSGLRAPSVRRSS